MGEDINTWKTGEFGGLLSGIPQVLDLFVVPRENVFVW